MRDARIFVEKKTGFQVEAESLKNTLNQNFNLSIRNLRHLKVYDIFNIGEELLQKAEAVVFSEPVTDNVCHEFPLDGLKYFAVEFLPGQFDQRADSALQCLKLLDPKTEAVIKSANLYVIEGDLTDDQWLKVKKYCINEVEAREKDMSKLELTENPEIQEVPIYNGFREWTEEQLRDFHGKMGLAMSLEDLKFIQQYFANDEKRDPSDTEIKLLDTYWSDHCRHTTFETAITDIQTEGDNIYKEQIENALREYLAVRDELYGKDTQRPVTLMDLASINGKYEYKRGHLRDKEISEENNACSIRVKVDVDNHEEDWLLMYKNETHNHPTEIEPFGGAATCVGGAIRDPLSGRSYVYQALRVTGAGDINAPISATLPGKLPQSVISKTAAAGYSSYGNQIGLATTHVREIYHPDYQAKRLEIGAVVGAVPECQVRRERPQPGDIIIMFGGRTGRDGIGGATGSSKEHNEKSLDTCSAEVQKGNAPEERKIQHLFRRPEVTKLIKKSNDFGAGGVSVAIGELADGLVIDLDTVRTKYNGLNGTEIAISESQERMSVVVAPEDVETFFQYCREENLEANIIAKVTDNNRLTMTWRGKTIVDLSRDFINTNGVRQQVKARIAPVQGELIKSIDIHGDTMQEKWISCLTNPNVASQKGLIEMFDATIGASTVLMPFGGKNQLTETQVSAQKLPVLHGHTDTTSIMAFGYNPFIATQSPFHAGVLAVLEAMSKVVAAGGNHHKIRFTFQEYFEKLGKDETRWGKPLSALLGAFWMQKAFGLASLGGKDSMSGTFKDMHVPPTIVSFAITTEDAFHIISPEFKQKGNYIYLVKNQFQDGMPDIDETERTLFYVRNNIMDKTIVSAFALQFGGIAEALAKMSFGNDLGFDVQTDEDLFAYGYGSFVIEATERLDRPPYCTLIGRVSDEFVINGEKLDKAALLAAWSGYYGKLYPQTAPNETSSTGSEFESKPGHACTSPVDKVSKPKVILPVFPGTNCDYDTARAFEDAGAETRILVFKNLDEAAIEHSIDELAAAIRESQILALSGGFSLGDEPDGSGKFIANVLNHPKVKAAVEDLLARKCLVLGICNGFQALVKSGLLPFGKLGEVTPESPTLYRNNINRHISRLVRTRVGKTSSPWLSSFREGDVHEIAVSHGEGKFVVSEPLAKQLFENGQVAFQYCDENGNVSMTPEDNPNGSFYAIEGIVSDNGLILGKMGHSERKGRYLYKNVDGNKEQDIFANAVAYFKG
ncbi:MAG: phosphoribosylformylglycinamidine synthase [Bacteroidales bacterium]|nr:phosphoribosylformylglycinamidine synthase [Bacteroidales bacterium]